MEKKELKIALLIDSENISAKYIESVMNEISNYGTLIISRFYGDIKSCSEEWKNAALKFSLKPMHQFNVASGKNAADMAMALDALEIMYNGKVDAFFLVTSDSDFTPLAMKLRENGMYVVGIGSVKKATDAFKASCKEFKYFEYLAEEIDEDSKKAEENKLEINEILKDVIVTNGIDNKILLSRLGDILVNRFSDFDPRKYGAKNLSSLLKTIPNLILDQDTTYVKFETTDILNQLNTTCNSILLKAPNKQLKLTKLKQELEKKFGLIDHKLFGFTKFSKLIESIDNIKVLNDCALLKDAQVN